MPSRYYFRPVSRGLGDLGAHIGSGLERGVENFETMRSRRRAERRQDVEDERRHQFEDFAESRAQAAERRAEAAETRLGETHPYNLERLGLGLDADRTNLALTGRQIGGGRYTEGMDLPEGMERYGGIYGFTPEAERSRDLDRTRPALSLLSRGLGREITPEMAAGAATLGLDPVQLVDPTGRIPHRRALDVAETRREHERDLAGYRESGQDRRQRERMWPAIKLDAFGGFDGEGNFQGWRADPEEMLAAEQEYLKTGETPRELPNQQQATTAQLPPGLTVQEVEQAVPALFQLGPKSEREARRMLKREKFTDEQIGYILDAFEDYARAQNARQRPAVDRGRLHER